MNKFQLWILDNVILPTILTQEVKKKMERIKGFLAGKKTYLVMVGLIVTALIKYAGDGNIGELVNAILIATGGITLKAGINRVENK